MTDHPTDTAARMAEALDALGTAVTAARAAGADVEQLQTTINTALAPPRPPLPPEPTRVGALVAVTSQHGETVVYQLAEITAPPGRANVRRWVTPWLLGPFGGGLTWVQVCELGAPRLLVDIPLTLPESLPYVPGDGVRHWRWPAKPLDGAPVLTVVDEDGGAFGIGGDRWYAIAGPGQAREIAAVLLHLAEEADRG